MAAWWKFLFDSAVDICAVTLLFKEEQWTTSSPFCCDAGRLIHVCCPELSLYDKYLNKHFSIYTIRWVFGLMRKVCALSRDSQLATRKVSKTFPVIYKDFFLPGLHSYNQTPADTYESSFGRLFPFSHFCITPVNLVHSTQTTTLRLVLWCNASQDKIPTRKNAS